MVIYPVDSTICPLNNWGQVSELISLSHKSVCKVGGGGILVYSGGGGQKRCGFLGPGEKDR